MSIQYHEIEQRFQELSNSVLGFSISEYCEHNENRQLYGIHIVTETQRLEALFGNPPDHFVVAINARGFFDTKAGYCVNVADIFPETGVNADVLLVSTEVLSSNPKVIDAILVHELCHLLINSKNVEISGLTLDSKARYHGEKLYKKTDIENQGTTKHTLEFCTVLAAAANRLQESNSAFLDRWDAIGEAMRYDLRSNITT